MRRICVSAAALMAATAIAVSPAAHAQRATKRVFVEVIDDKDLPVLDLTARDFELSEEYAEREVTRAVLCTAPMRIVLIVDSSTSTQPMMTKFRNALTAFIDHLPLEHEVAFITSGGQIRVRTPPTTDHTRLKNDIGLLQSEGGANAFLETLLEADQRFLKPAAGKWPVFVILTTDIGEVRREPDIPRYNRFMNDFLARGGSAHAIIMQGKSFGPVTDITQNFVQNMGGMYLSLIVDSGLPARMTAVAERLAADHTRLATWYEVEFNGDAKLAQPTVSVAVKRDGVEARVSTRRPN